MQEKKFLISEKLANDILNYLGECKYKEVFKLIEGLLKLESPPVPKPPKKEDKVQEC